MHFIKNTAKQKRKDFVKKIKSGKILRVPGAYNPLTAKLIEEIGYDAIYVSCLLYTSPSPRDRTRSRMPSSA